MKTNYATHDQKFAGDHQRYITLHMGRVTVHTTKDIVPFVR